MKHAAGSHFLEFLVLSTVALATAHAGQVHAQTAPQSTQGNVSLTGPLFVSGCPAADSVIDQYIPSRLRVGITYRDGSNNLRSGVPPESIWVTMARYDPSSNLVVNDVRSATDGYVWFVAADDSTRNGVTTVTVTSFSGCGFLSYRVYIDGLLVGSGLASVQTTDSDANGKVEAADTVAVCDLNDNGNSSQNKATVRNHLGHSHRNALHGTLVRRTNLPDGAQENWNQRIGEGDESWSPDGKTIAFSKHDSVLVSTCVIYLVPSDPRDGDALQKFSFPQEGLHDYDPSWSPLGTFIVWDRRDSLILRKGLATLGADSSEFKVFDSGLLGGASETAVSPDGKNVAFTGVPPTGGYTNIWAIPIDGGTPVRVTSNPTPDLYPKWSPDGLTILFYRYTGGQYALYKANYPPHVPGGESGTLVWAPSTGSVAFPQYSADGQIILAGIGPTVTGSFTLNTIDPGLGASGPAIRNYATYASLFPVPRQSPDGTRTALLTPAPGAVGGNSQVWAARRSMDLPPVITSVGAQTIDHRKPYADFTIGQDTTITLTYARSDPEGNALTDHAYFLQQNLGMSFTPSTQTLSWPVGEAAVGVYTVKFAVTEASGGTDYALARITVRDITPPKGITDLTFNVDPNNCTNFLLTWTAPADDSSFVATGRATRYDMKISSSSIDSNWTPGAGLSRLPSTPGAIDSAYVTVGAGLRRYIRIKTKDEIPNWSPISNQITIDGPPLHSDCLGGGGMFAGGGGGGGYRTRPGSGPASLQATGTTWSGENTLLNGVNTGIRAGDLFSLPALAAASSGSYAVRIRELSGHSAVMDDARLLTVDHSSSVSAFIASGKPVLGSRVPPVHATDGTRTDVTALVDGSTTNAFAGDSGATITVQLTADSTIAADPIVIEASGLGWSSSGILVQVPDGPTGWRTVGVVHPRLYFDALAVDSIASAQVRLFFLGTHQVRFVGRVARSSETPTLQWAQLTTAQDSRLGGVLAALASADTASATVAGPDTLLLSFAAPTLAQGQVRECFLAVDATPLVFLSSSATPSARLQPNGQELPVRFALRQNQPNPFGSSTTIRFDLPVGAMVKLEIFDVQGRRAKMVTNHYYPAGSQAAQWDRRDEAGIAAKPGIYLYRLTAGSFRDQKKMVLLP